MFGIDDALIAALLAGGAEAAAAPAMSVALPAIAEAATPALGMGLEGLAGAGAAGLEGAGAAAAGGAESLGLNAAAAAGAPAAAAGAEAAAAPTLGAGTLAPLEAYGMTPPGTSLAAPHGAGSLNAMLGGLSPAAQTAAYGPAWGAAAEGGLGRLGTALAAGAASRAFQPPQQNAAAAAAAGKTLPIASMPGKGMSFQWPGAGFGTLGR